MTQNVNVYVCFSLILVNHFKFDTPNMQSDHRVPTINTAAMRQQHRKRSYSNGALRKRERTDLICVVCHAPAMGIKSNSNVFFS